MNFLNLIYLCCFVLAISAVSCSPDPTPAAHRYAISWYYPNQDYQRWIHTQDSSAVFIELYGHAYNQLDSILATCDGLILTGGLDIAPSRYGKVDSLSLCKSPNLRRDSIEFKAMQYAKKTGIPTLGVCRGMQIINVSFGGDLLLDIPSFNGSTLHQKEGTDARHLVYTAPEMEALIKADTATTNSNHHQAVGRIGDGLQPLAWSTDSIVEAIRHMDTEAFPFLWGVQWHPERMPRQSPMSKNLLSSFIHATRP
ncbi:MAG: type 1 glutamine amidotransferase [Cryomorphaceae bacterium]